MGTAPQTANVEMARAWDGDEGDNWTENEDRYNAAVALYNPILFAAAAIAQTDSVLDIGCGCGVTTREAARIAGDGDVLGVDLSSRMIERARRHARDEQLANVSFEQADAQVHTFEPEAFDVVISRFGAMFFADPIAAFQNIGRAMRSGARLALLSWQGMSRNPWVSSIRDALAAGRTLPEPPSGQPGPFGLSDPAEVRRILESAAFETPVVEPAIAPLSLGSDAEDALRFVTSMGITRGLLGDLDPATADRALVNLRATFAEHETPAGVRLDGSAWVITARRA